jgi:hypothetical protein
MNQPRIALTVMAVIFTSFCYGQPLMRPVPGDLHAALQKATVGAITKFSSYHGDKIAGVSEPTWNSTLRLAGVDICFIQESKDYTEWIAIFDLPGKDRKAVLRTYYAWVDSIRDAPIEIDGEKYFFTDLDEAQMTDVQLYKKDDLSTYFALEADEGPVYRTFTLLFELEAPRNKPNEKWSFTIYVHLDKGQ